MALFALLFPLILLPALALAEAYGARRGTKAANAELRALRLQVSNVVEMLQAAGFKKPKHKGWEDDWKETQLMRESVPPSISWFRAKPH